MIFDFLIFAARFLKSIVNSVSTVELWIVSRLIHTVGDLCSTCLGTRGLIVWLYCTVSLSPVRIVSRDPFSVFSEASTSTCLQKGRSTRSRCAEKAARFFVACKAKSSTRLSIPAAMRAQMSRPWIESLPSRCAESPKKIMSNILVELRQ
jgi:hypothetical protein